VAIKMLSAALLSVFLSAVVTGESHLTVDQSV